VVTKIKMEHSNFLLRFAHEHLNFRIPEILSIAGIFGFNINIGEEYDIKSPYLVVELPSELCARQLMSRAVTVRSAYELWAEDVSYHGLFEKLRCLPRSLTDRFTNANASYRVLVDSFNKQICLHDRIARVETLLTDVLPFNGRMDLSATCDNTFCFMEYYGPQGTVPSDNPSMVFFGRWLVDGQREMVSKYQLQRRNFIGNTSMDPMLSMIISNMASVKDSDLVFDPFVGTGSLLVACAHHGAYIVGTDIDYNLLLGIGKSSRAGQKWRKKDETIFNNLQQYGLGCRYIDILVADASQSHIWRPQMLFDAIVADPPYGIREPTQKLGSRKETSSSSSSCDGHIPAKTAYSMTEIIFDLLHFAAKYLTVNGHLVYWIPVHREDYKPSNIPQHECFELIANSEQILNSRISRRLITMKKVKQLDGEENGDLLHLEDDHYAEVSFRDRYFRPQFKSKRSASSDL